MFETLKKIGVPTALATAIVLLVLLVPFLFKIDERYAKQTMLEAEVDRLDQRNVELTRELAQNTGFQQAMIAIMQNRTPPETAKFAQKPLLKQTPVAIPVPTTVEPEPQVTQTLEEPKTLKDLSASLLRQQQRLIKPSR
jgi:hypothetical protein